jgi:hypothetical protein
MWADSTGAAGGIMAAVEAIYPNVQVDSTGVDYVATGGAVIKVWHPRGGTTTDTGTGGEVLDGETGLPL